jgi:hypothetical protein
MSRDQRHPIAMVLIIVWGLGWFAFALWALIHPAGLLEYFNWRLGRMFDLSFFGFHLLLFFLYIPSQSFIFAYSGYYQGKKRTLPAESPRLRWLRAVPLILLMLAWISGTWAIMDTPPFHLAPGATVQLVGSWFAVLLLAALLTCVWILAHYGLPGDKSAHQKI